MYSTLIQACLMRAALIRSKVSDFHNKRRDVQIVFLNNGYSMNFIKEHAEQLFQDFHISNWKSNLNQNTYDKMREEIIEYDQQHQEYELLSPTQVLTGQQQKQEPVQPQKGEEVKRKKKSRGNRKAQRRCGRRRRKVKESIKRKRNKISSKQSLNTIDKSLSQLSISQSSRKKKQKMANHEIEQITTNGTSDNKRSKPKREINHNNDYSYISDYLQVTNRIFKQMLISSLEGADKIVKR
ncbi:unnamed protein product [Rotaria sp. Silwood1]|nr:unnamed protein product [Rotaria sp. Silwood1]